MCQRVRLRFFDPNLECARLMRRIRFADQRTGQVYGELKGGIWEYQNSALVNSGLLDNDTLTALEALGWNDPQTQSASEPGEAPVISKQKLETLGEWQFDQRGR